MNMHSDQVPITEELVCRLVHGQFPEWTHLPVERVASKGTVNAMFRIGSQLAARFPLRAEDPVVVQATFEKEAAAARELVEHTSCPVPETVAIGSPCAGYPMPWAVQTWLPGSTALIADPGDSVEFAFDLAAFVSEVRSIDPQGRVFAGVVRGGDLQDHDEWMNHCFEQSEPLLDVPLLRTMWSRFRALPQHTGDVMSHGDLTPSNVLVRAGRLSGVLDFGFFGPADPALDLIPAWHILGNRARGTFRSALQCTDVEWNRGQAWAFQQAMGLVWYYRVSNPAMSEFGRRTLKRLAAEYGHDL